MKMPLLRPSLHTPQAIASLSGPRGLAVLRLAVAFVISHSSSVIAQGPLTPPGAPAPTMKTLDQIEPRTVINATNTPGDANNTFIITAPGSYCLTANLTAEAGKHGISIQANDVTLDLRGFALLGGGVGVRGIDVPAAQTSLHICNGSVRGWTGGGVRVESAINVLAEKLRLVDNAGAVGLQVGNGALVRDCTASGNETGFRSGDRSQFLSCISTINSNSGFLLGAYVMIADCTASRNNGNGIQTGGASSILRCSATRNSTGIDAPGDCTIGDCTASYNTVWGISSYRSTITRCAASGNVSDGITNGEGRVADCTARDNGGDGIGAFSASGCTAANNGGHGIVTLTASACATFDNGGTGLRTSIATNCESRGNVVHGIESIHNASITHCSAFQNGSNGIDAGFNGVVAFCVARTNNLSNNGSSDIIAGSTTRMMNDPSP